MLFYKKYKEHQFEILGKRQKYDNNIYTFDIETTSYIINHDEILSSIEYENLSEKEKSKAIKQSTMYIWMFSINEQVYYGRTWSEFKEFLNLVFENSKDFTKIIFIHNLSFEFEYLKSVIPIDEVYARTSGKPMKAISNELNLEFRCSYMMSNCSLARLADLYKLPVKKLVGNLDYSLIRHSKTYLSEEELAYCENDCLVVYEYIKYELKTYPDVKHIPITSTGHVRRELQNITRTDYSYKAKVRKAVNTDGHIYNLLLQAFAGGYTHANYLYTDSIIKNVTSWDFTSSYPYCLCTFKYPAAKFRRCNIKDINELSDRDAYLIKIRFNKINSKYYNHFISKSKCLELLNEVVDNGRLVSADYCLLTITEVDLQTIIDSYTFESYEIIECYYSYKKYLPRKFINFILDKYVLKTKYKNDPEHELEYAKEKSLFNSLYGMCVTNTIRDEIDFKNNEWIEIPLNNNDILDKLLKEEKDGFLSFAWGVWCTSYARSNLLNNIMKVDEYCIYSDTDSLKLKSGYDVSVIEEYNKNVLKRIKEASKVLDIPIEKFAPKDIKGIEHPLGVFDNDGNYLEFITQGAKKYAYKYIKKGEEKIGITVSGVPKSGYVCLKGDLNNFRDGLVFDYRNTNKNTVLKCEEQRSVLLEDYRGIKYEVSDKSGFCMLPTTYLLGKAEEYFNYISENSSARSIYKEL